MAASANKFITWTSEGEELVSIGAGAQQRLIHKLFIMGASDWDSTIFANAGQVAEELGVKPDYLMYWLAEKREAQHGLFSEEDGDAWIIDADDSPEKWSKDVDEFIDHCVICGACGLPNLSFVPLRNEVLRNEVGVKCTACNWRGLIGDLGVSKRFEQFVRDNPPPRA